MELVSEVIRKSTTRNFNSNGINVVVTFDNIDGQAPENANAYFQDNNETGNISVNMSRNKNGQNGLSCSGTKSISPYNTLIGEISTELEAIFTV
jgi:hypothetical protein